MANAFRADIENWSIPPKFINATTDYISHHSLKPHTPKTSLGPAKVNESNMFNFPSMSLKEKKHSFSPPQRLSVSML